MFAPRLFLIGVAALVVLTSCAAEKNIIVLLPDAEGKTGRIVVSNEGGTTVVEGANQATLITSAGTAPTVPVPLADEKISENFGEALSALPAPPLHFSLYFLNDSTELTDASRKALSRILPAAVSRNSRDVSIVGHADRVGTRCYNYRLGLKRANLVSKMLVSLGIPPDSIEVTSHGEDNPAIMTGDEVPEPKNRRTEVIVR